MSEYFCKECRRKISKRFDRGTEERFVNVCRTCRQRIRNKEKNLQRNCPSCNKVITYNYVSDYNLAIQNNTSCKKCMNNSGQFKQGQIPLENKSHYEWWTLKYGKEEADTRLKLEKEKHSFNSKGEKNHMFNKPTPIGAGNGWSGWYNDWYFRSLHELSYMINVIERFNLSWKSAENKNLTIFYFDWNKEKRTYRADFLINDKYLVECKPKKLWNSSINILKRNAAIEFCKSKNLTYKMISPNLLDDEVFLRLYQENKIKFLEKYDTKFKTRFRIP